MKTIIDNLKQRIGNNFKKNKKLLFVFIIIWATIIVTSCIYYQNTIGKDSIGNESYNRSVVEIDKDTKLSAKIPVEQNGESVSILFATYARNNDGYVTIRVTGEKSKHLYVEKTINVTKIVDNDYVTLKLDKLAKNENDNYLVIDISSNSNKGEAVGVYYSNIAWFQNSSLTINNQIIEDSDLCLKFLLHDEQMLKFSRKVIAWSVLGLTTLALIALLVDPKKEIMYAIAVFVLGLIMMVIIVPASPPDELSNYEVALQVSNLIMGEEPHHIDAIYLKYGYMYGHYNISPGYERFMNEINGTLKLTGNLETLNRDYSTIYWIQYIPNAIGLTIGRLLKCNMITTFYAGRMFGLLFYTLCIYIAIKKASSYKNVIGMVSILPMLTQISIAITHDVFILGLSFVSLGYFIKWYFQEEKISVREFIFVFIVCLGLAPAKVLYSFFAFLFIFVPYKNYGSKKLKFVMVLILLGPAIYQLYGIMNGPIQILVSVIKYLFFNKEANIHLTLSDNFASYVKTGINSLDTFSINKQTYSFKYMFGHPLEILDIFIRTIRYKIKYWFYGSIGRNLSGETLVLPIKLVHILVGTLLVSLFVKQDKLFTVPMKMILIGICIVVGLYAMVGMLVSWTSYNQEIIEDYGGLLVEGIQGRYFSPVLPYFFITFANKKIVLPKSFEQYSFLAYIFVFFEVVLYVLSYTFVN